MMKVMSSFSDVRTQHVFGWVSIMWLASALSVADSVTLRTDSQVAARCGDNVTLNCDASSSGQLGLLFFSWLARNKTVCMHLDGEYYKSQCEMSAQHDAWRLTLTLLNVMPGDQGSYLCKLRSTVGADSKTTVLTVQDCMNSSDSSISESHAKCWFSGVYPSGTVHWFQGDVNLTDLAGTQEEVDQLGRYNVRSTIDVQRGNKSQPYTCSLWIPSAGKYLSSQEIPLLGRLHSDIDSSGSMVKLQWICIMMEIMMVKFMT